jgi:hypothetical protein
MLFSHQEKIILLLLLSSSLLLLFYWIDWINVTKLILNYIAVVIKLAMLFQLIRNLKFYEECPLLGC